MDREVLTTVFRLLDAAVHDEEVAYTEIDATSPDGIALVTLLAVPSYIAQRWLKTIENEMTVRKIGRDA
jgi:hypothetical protein